MGHEEKTISGNSIKSNCVGEPGIRIADQMMWRSTAESVLAKDVDEAGETCCKLVCYRKCSSRGIKPVADGGCVNGYFFYLSMNSFELPRGEDDYLSLRRKSCECLECGHNCRKA